MDLWSRHAVSAMVTMQVEKYNVEQEKHCSPFKSAMVVPVILGLISDNPGYGCSCNSWTDFGQSGLHQQDVAGLLEGIWEGVRLDGIDPARGFRQKSLNPSRAKKDS